MSFEAPPTSGNFTARLRSPLLPSTGGAPNCLQFWFAFNNLLSGGLTVYTTHQDTQTSGQEIWRSLSNNRGTWEHVKSSYRTTDNYFVSTGHVDLARFGFEGFLPYFNNEVKSRRSVQHTRDLCFTIPRRILLKGGDFFAT